MGEGTNTASHILLWVILLGIGGWLAYSATHSQTENNRYAPGSASYDVKLTEWPLSFGCVPINVFHDKDAIKPTKIDKAPGPVPLISPTIVEVKK